MKKILLFVFVFFIPIFYVLAQNPANKEEEEEQLWKTEEKVEESTKQKEIDQNESTEEEESAGEEKVQDPKKKKKKKKKKEKLQVEVEGVEIDSTKNPYDDFGIDEEDSVGKITSADTTEVTDNKKGKREKKGPGPVLLAFEKFHFNLSSGYGITSWRSSNYLYNDTTRVLYKGTAYSVPVNFQILYDFGKIRFGGGAQMEIFHLGSLKPNNYEKIIPTYKIGSGTFKKFYGHLGYMYFQNRLYSYLADLEVGMFKGSSALNTAGNGMRPFVNLGITLERRYSEYFRMFIKPSLEFKGQPFALDNNLPVNSHRLMTFYFQFGMSYSIPILPKCPVPLCGIRKRHNHKNRIFRGNPYQRLQIPNYGEEDRTMIKYRGKNKRRIDPF